MTPRRRLEVAVLQSVAPALEGENLGVADEPVDHLPHLHSWQLRLLPKKFASDLPAPAVRQRSRETRRGVAVLGAGAGALDGPCVTEGRSMRGELAEEVGGGDTAVHEEVAAGDERAVGAHQ